MSAAPQPLRVKARSFGRPTLLIELEGPPPAPPSVFGLDVAGLASTWTETARAALAGTLSKKYGAELVPIGRREVKGLPMAPVAPKVRSAALPRRRERAFSRLHFPAPTDPGELPELARKVAAEAGVRRVVPLPPASPATVPTPTPVGPQSYLDAAPDGLGVVAVGSHAGDRVRVIDVEGDWVVDHECYGARVKASPLWGQGVGDPGWRSHGSAVLGILSGRGSPSGIAGIAPGCEYQVVSHWDGVDSLVYEAITAAAPHLGKGDILLIEAQAPGPSVDFQQDDSQSGYIAMEWWDHIFEAVKELTDRDTIVVAAAGNGGVDLDDPVFGGLFDAATRDSGAILVGAGASPNGGQASRTRLSFSNHGARVDVQGWGESVVTAGYGNLFGTGEGLAESRWYTDTFGGTSSAAAMIAGVCAALQQERKVLGRDPVPALTMRDLLRTVGSAPAGGGDEGIGLLPDFGDLLQRVRAMP